MRNNLLKKYTIDKKVDKKEKKKKEKKRTRYTSYP